MNKKHTPILLLVVLLVVSIVACKKETDPYKDDHSLDYFPLSLGKYVVYDVDSVLWDDFLCVRSLHRYQMRYTVSDTFTDNQRRPSYRMDVHIRRADSLPWLAHRVFYVTGTENRLEWVEGNIRYIKLAYPIKSGTTWKGNSMIPALDQDLRYLSDWTYEYSNYTGRYNQGDTYFDNTVTVNHVDEQQNDPETMPDSYSYKTFSKEVYGHNIGLVYKELIHWTYDPAPGITQCRKGYSVTMKAIDYN